MHICWRGLTFVLLMSLLGSACATHAELRREMVDDVRFGAYVEANQLLQDLVKSGNKKDLIMNLMDQAMILHLVGEYKASNRILEKIKSKLDDLYGTDWGDELAAIAWNDTARAFEGEEFEKVMVNMLAAFNYLQMNNLEDAGVEARQINHNLQVYTDHLAKNNVSTSYVQDPFAQYLSGIIQEGLGDENDALLSYRDAINGYNKIGRIMGVQAPAALMTAILRVAREIGYEEVIEEYESQFSGIDASEPQFWQDKAKLVVLGSFGEVAHKVSQKWIIPDPEFDTIVIVYPEFVRGHFLANNVSVKVDGKNYRTYPVHNLSTLAIKMLDDKNDQVKARAIAKTILMYAAKKVTKAIAKNAKSTAAKVGALLANIALNVVDMVQEADTRTWMTLPDNINMVEIPLAPGVHKVVVKYSGSGMRDVQVFNVPLKAGETRFIISRGREPGNKKPNPPAMPWGLKKKTDKNSIHVSQL